MSETKLRILKDKLFCFFDDTKDVDLRLKSAHEFIDQFEYFVQSPHYTDILEKIYDKSQKLLLQTNPCFIQDYPLQQLRKQCLEIFTKIQNNEVNKPFSKNFMNVLMKLIEIENEENTILCVRLLVDIHKTQRPAYSPEVSTFLKFVRNVYKELQNHTNKIFCHPTNYDIDAIENFSIETKILETFTSTKILTNQTDSTGKRIEHHLLPKSCYSLKVMHEIPVLLVLIYQFHKTNVSNEIASFIPLIMDFLNLMPTESQKNDVDFNQSLYLDFLQAQVKTLSFLAYVVRFFKKPLVEKYADQLVQGMYKLILNIPSDVTNMRKEYFIATRHILGVQEIKPKFNKVLPELMDEEILIGSGYTVNQLLRPLAYSTLADLIHFVKNDLTLGMISKATNMYIKNMHDDTLVFSIQQMSMKLLLNFIEPIKNKATVTDYQECRQLMLKILYALVQRLGTVRKFFLPRLEKDCLSELLDKSPSPNSNTTINLDDQESKNKTLQEPTSSSTAAVTAATTTIATTTATEQPSTSTESTDTVTNPEEDNSEMPVLPRTEEKPIKPEHNLILPLLTLQDLRNLTRHLIHGIKTVTKDMISLQNKMASLQNPTIPPERVQMSSRYIDGQDVLIYSKFIRNSLRVLDLYLIYCKEGQYYRRTSSFVTPKAIDEKTILENISFTFLQLSQTNFKEVFEGQIEYIIKQTVSNNYIIQLFQMILNNHQEENPSNSSILANLMLNYLLKNMEVIGEGTPESQLYIRLFKLIFNSVHNNLGCFENVLEMHLKRIVLGCMHYALSAKEPNSFMCLLRYLFRSIGGGAHEKLYKEFLPLLPLMLTGLSRLLRSPHVNQVRDLLGELCVIVPVRLSTLLPHLSLLMEPLVHVLSCNTISQGLRTLELCVDNMTPDYLYQNMYPVRGDIMFAMLKSFRFKSEQVNRTAFKVLGKMGRYNRIDLSECQNIRVESWNNDWGVEIKFRYQSIPDEFVNLPVKDMIRTSLVIVKTEKTDSTNKDKIHRYEKAYQCLKSFLIKFVDSFDKDLKLNQFDITRFGHCLKHHLSHVEYTECKWLGLYSSSVMAEENIVANNEGNDEKPKEEEFDDDICNIPDYSRTSNATEYMLVRNSLFGLLLGCTQEVIRKNEFDSLVDTMNQFIYCSMAEQTNYCNSLYGNKSNSTNKSANSGDNQQLLIVTNLLVDALSDTYAYEDKECVRLGTIFLERVCTMMNSSFETELEASKLPIFTVFVRKIIHLLHGDAWYAKWGGCSLLMFLVHQIHPAWLWRNLLDLVKSLFYSINDLYMQIGQHALKMTQDCLELILEKSFGKDMRSFDSVNHEKLLLAVCEYLTILLLSENEMVRQESQKLITLLCKISGRTSNSLLEPQLNVVADLVPPNTEKFLAFPITKQIAVLELNYLFSNHYSTGNIVSYNIEIKNQEKFICELRAIVESQIGGLGPEDDHHLNPTSSSGGTAATSQTVPTVSSSYNPSYSGICSNKLYSWNLPLHDSGCKQAYLSVESFKQISLKVAACKLLSTIWYIDSEKEKNFQVLFKAMCSKHIDIHETAFKSLQDFLSHTTVPLELRNANLKPLLTTFRENYSLTTNRHLFYCARLFVASFSERMCESLITKIKPILDSVFSVFDKHGYIDVENNDFKLLIKTIELFHVLQAASNKYVQSLTDVVLKVEQHIFSCSTSPLRRPLILYLSKCPVDTVKLFLHNQNYVENSYARIFFLACLKLPEARPIRDHLQTQSEILIDMLKRKLIPTAIIVPGSSQVYEEPIDRAGNNDMHHYAISIIYRLAKCNREWWGDSIVTANSIKTYCLSEACVHRISRIDQINYIQWKDLDRMLYLMMLFVEYHPEDYDYLFSISKTFKIRGLGSQHKLRMFLMRLYASKPGIWKQRLFRHFMDEAVVVNEIVPQAITKHSSWELLYLIFSNIILPMYWDALIKVTDDREKIDLMGGPPRPNDESDDIITVFLNKMIEKQEYGHGGLKVSYYQFCILILEYAPNYIHDVSNKKKGHKARIILTFAWPSLSVMSPFTDLLEKYVGLQTLAYLISKFNISRSIIMRVFVSLAKGNIVEPKKVVNAALDVLVPAWLQRKDDINFLILHTKKVANDDVTSQSYLHIGNLIVRHQDLFFQGRCHMQPLLHHFIMRLNNQNFQPDQRRCLLDMLELIIRWDIKSKDQYGNKIDKPPIGSSNAIPEKQLTTSQKEVFVNFIIRLLIQTLEQNQATALLVETSCKRIVRLIETAFHPKVWGPVNLNLESMVRYFKFENNPSSQPNNAQIQSQYNNMFQCLDLLTSFIKVMNNQNILTNMKLFSKPFCELLSNSKFNLGVRFMRYFGILFKTLLTKFPAEASNKPKISPHPELIDIYITVLKVMQDSFGSYEAKPSSPNSNKVQSAILILNMTQQVKVNAYAFIDRCLMNLVNMGLKLVTEIKTNTQNANHADDVEQLIGVIDIIKSRFNVLGADMRRNKVIRMFHEAISVNKDGGRLIRVVINALRDWMKLPKTEEHFSPSSREKSELFVKLWQRYPTWSDNIEIQKEILTILLLVYENEQLQIEDVDNTFAVAFTHGIVSNSFEVRQKYLEIFAKSMKTNANLLERFIFLISVNQWNNRYFPLTNWIPTFLEILLYDIQEDDELEFIPRKGSLLNRTNRDTNQMISRVVERMEVDENSFRLTLDQSHENIHNHHLFQLRLPGSSDRSFKYSIYDFFKLDNIKSYAAKSRSVDISELPSRNRMNIPELFEAHKKCWSFMDKINVGTVISNIIPLFYNFSNVSDEIFQILLVQLWTIMLKKYENYKAMLKQDMIRFIVSPCHEQHIGQSSVNPFATFLAAVSKIPDFLEWLHDSVFACMTSIHNQWYLGTLIFEDTVYRLKDPKSDCIFLGTYASQTNVPSVTSSTNNSGSTSRIDFNGVVTNNEFLISLNVMYEALGEDDYQFGLWTEKMPINSEMKEALCYAQRSQFDEALRMSHEAYNVVAANPPESPDVIMKHQKFFEFNLRFLKQLGHWDTLDRRQNENTPNYYFKAESLWRNGQWKELSQISKYAHASVPDSDRWKCQLIHFYNLIMQKVSPPQIQPPTNQNGAAQTPPEESNVVIVDSNQIEKEFQKLTALILQQWKSLPDKSFNTSKHVGLLQACNLAIEAWDGHQIFTTVRNNVVANEIKNLIKSWKNRLPNKNDNFSFWADLVLWRKSVFEKLNCLATNTTNTSTGTVTNTDVSRSYKQEIYTLLLELIKSGRKQHLASSARCYLEKLKSLYPELTMNSFANPKQECKIKMFEENRRHSYVECLEMLEGMDAQQFKENRDLAQFFCYKAILFSYFNKGDDATLNFGYALQMDPNNNKIWSIYADFLENVFSNYPQERRSKASHTTGIFAITALVEAASPLRQSTLTTSQVARGFFPQGSHNWFNHEEKLCPNLAKCLWLITLDHGPDLLMARRLEELSGKLPASTLLPWIRSLLICLIRPESQHIEPMIHRVANEFPEVVYQALKCLREQLVVIRSRRKSGSGVDGCRATNLIVVDNLINKIHKTNGCKLFMLDSFCSSLEWLSSIWSEQLYAQFVHINAKLMDYAYTYIIKFNNFVVLDEIIPEFIIIELQNLHTILDFSSSTSNTIMMEVDNSGKDENEHYLNMIFKIWGVWLGLTNKETICKQYQTFINSKSCQDIRYRFNIDFDNLRKLKIKHVLKKLRKVWLPMLRKIINLQARSYIDERNQMLLDIGKSSGDLSLPGDLGKTKKREHRLNIASIMPVVKTKWVNNKFCKLLTIKASNGHSFQYLTILDNTSYLSNHVDIRNCARTVNKFWFQERIFQLFKAINECMSKKRESFRRGMKFLVPRLMEVNSNGFYIYQIGDGINPILHRNFEDEDLKFVSLKDIWIRYKMDRMKDMNSNSKEILNDPKYYLLKKLSEDSSLHTVNMKNNQFMDKKRKQIIDLFKEISELSGNSALISFARYFLKSPEDYWNFRKNITMDLALLNLCQLLFNISTLNPSQYVFEIRKGKIQIIDPEIELNNDAYIARAHKYNFRLSQNLIKFIQPSGEASSLWNNSSQPYTAFMSVAADVIQDDRNNLMAHVRAIFRDYLVIWHQNNYQLYNKQKDLSNNELENWLNNIVDRIYKVISTASDDSKYLKKEIEECCDKKLMSGATLSYESWI